MVLAFVILLILFLLLHSIRTIYSSLKIKGKINPHNKLGYILIIIDMIALWIVWFKMCEMEYNTVIIQTLLNYIGFNILIY